MRVFNYEGNYMKLYEYESPFIYKLYCTRFNNLKVDVTRVAYIFIKELLIYTC